MAFVCSGLWLYGSLAVSQFIPKTTRADGNQPKIHMPAEQPIVTEGKIVAVLAGTMFRVELPNKHQVLAHISGKMRKRFIRLTLGDRVKIEMSPYDMDKARIVYRLGDRDRSAMTDNR
jgi:translation initiation factor IF-1